jgi:segregation and condensation protein B
MSLKAKLEAVIYAAEEPVTLAQLAALFATDALEWKAAQEAASAAAAAEQAETGNETPAALIDGLDSIEQLAEYPSAAAPDGADAGTEPAALPMELENEDAATEPSSQPVAEPVAERAAEPAAESSVDAEAEEKRMARARDREVRAILRGLLDELIAAYASDDRGIEIKEIAGGYRMATKPECHDAARMFVKSLKPAMKLSLPALETLAVIAYKQPVTAPEVNEIRGVDSSGVFGSLLARKLIATAGRKQVIGRPILYKTTKEFLLRFGLKDVQELPSMEEFEKIAQLEFEDMEPLPDEGVSAPANEDLSLELELSSDDEREEAAALVAQETQEGAKLESNETAVTADGEKYPAPDEPDAKESIAGTPATEAETTPAEAAPAVPSPLEQAETETVPHD